MKKGYIYKITSPIGNVYIGQTFNLYVRINKYKNLHCKEQIRIFNSIKCYGWENHKFEIIEELFDDLDDREIYWISEYKSNCRKYPEIDGLNLTDGGKTSKGKIITEETKQKISIANKGKKHSQEAKNKMSEIKKGKKQSIETLLKLSSTRKGKTPWNKGIKTGKQSEESTKKRSESMKQTLQKKKEIIKP